VPLIESNHRAAVVAEPEDRRRAGGLGSFHVHRGHTFEGFQLVAGLVEARCVCGVVLDVADAVFDDCPDCRGESCSRCGGTRSVVNHAALEWRLPDRREAV
jgi:hypothetical protein